MEREQFFQQECTEWILKLLYLSLSAVLLETVHSSTLPFLFLQFCKEKLTYQLFT